MTVMLHTGDCREVMRTMAPDSVDAIVCDPPYGLAFMGKGWDHAVPGVDYWTEALRVAKPGAHLLAFGGTRTFHRMVCAIEDAGWEIRDRILWLYGSGFPKSHNLHGEWEGWGTALKPAHEPVIVARKPLIGTVAANVAAFGPGALNIDACRIEPVGPDDYTFAPGDHGVEGRTRTSGFALSAGKLSALGRWPANVIHDGSEEVLGAFPETAGRNNSGPSLSVMAQANCYGEYGPRDCGSRFNRDAGGSAARFFYCAKADRADRNDGCENLPAKLFGMSSAAAAAAARGEHYDNGDGGVNRVTSRQNNHPTVKPTDLMRYLCRLVTPPGGLVLDPFMGSGSTGRAAVAEGFSFVGIELDPAYAAIAQARIDAVQPGLALALIA